MRMMRSLILLTAAFMVSISSASAAELAMFRQDGCPWCAAWDRDIGPIYGKTDIGRRVPLQMVDIHRDRLKFMLKNPIIYTPTFVLVDKGREVGRIEGYISDYFFWGLLERLLEQLPPEAASGLSATPKEH
jgi:thioredoxin-related protein